MEELDDYILRHIDDEGDYLRRLYRDTNVKLLRPRMASGHLQGRLLKMFVRLCRAKSILEIGTYSGYSALCMAEGLEEGGKLYTFEINDEQEDFTRPWLENSPYADKIEFIIGDVMELLPSMVQERGLMFDMAFVDGDKRHYTDYYEMLLPHLAPGALLLADNTLWDGHVIDPAYDRDAQTKGIRAFNDLIAGDDRVEKVILPLRDGLTLIRKK
jgi:predicted O-methyltransferase YrrM